MSVGFAGPLMDILRRELDPWAALFRHDGTETRYPLEH
jgi:hypothetical protein